MDLLSWLVMVVTDPPTLFAFMIGIPWMALLFLQVLFAGLTGNAHHYIVNGEPIDIIKIY